MDWRGFGLDYFRTKEGRGFDFLLLQNRTPRFLFETKTADDTPSPSPLRFQKALGIPAARFLATAPSLSAVPPVTK